MSGFRQSSNHESEEYLSERKYVARKDWEDIKRKHGKERAFTAMPPLLWEMRSEKDFKARRDEIAEMKTGVEPVDPKSVGVEEVKRSEV